MKRQVLITSLLVMLLATGGTMAAAADVSGTWACLLNLDGGPQNVSQTFVFEQQGEKLTGVHISGLGEHNLTGTIKGEKVVFRVEGTNKNGQPFKITYTGTIASPTSIRGNVEHMKGPGNRTATKK